MDEHIAEALGMARVVIKDGKVVEVGEPRINYCPLFDKYRGIKKITSDAIKENMEFRIQDFGMCTSQRVLKMPDFLSFGISETLSTLLKERIIDCAVVVCEGAGTVIVTDPQLVQGIGGRISGFISTYPIKEIIKVLGEENVLDPEHASIDQVSGVIKSIQRGFKNISVTVTNPDDAVKLRDIEKKHEGVNIFIFSVHTTGISLEGAQTLFDNADVITACASKHLRDLASKKRVFQAGESIPIYGVTPKGISFLKLRIEKIGGLKKKKNAKSPAPLI